MTKLVRPRPKYCVTGGVLFFASALAPRACPLMHCRDVVACDSGFRLIPFSDRAVQMRRPSMSESPDTSIAASRDQVRTPIVRVTDQQPAHVGLAHGGKGDRLRQIGQAPIGRRGKPRAVGPQIASRGTKCGFEVKQRLNGNFTPRSNDGRQISEQ
jgi:hypothetical protein